MGKFRDFKITEQELAEHGMTSLSGTKWTNQAAMLKKKLDEDGTFVGERLGQVLDAMEDSTAAANIGAAPFGKYTATTVQGLVEETTVDLQGKLDNVVAGVLPDDAVTTEKIRDGAVTASKIADGAVTHSKIPDASIDGSKLSQAYRDGMLSPATAALYGLGAEATPNDVHVELAKRSHNSLLRDLNIMMNQSLSTSNYDAWADLLIDASRINTGASSGYSISGGQLTAPKVIVQNSAINGQYLFGDSAGNQKVGQTITATASGQVSKIGGIGLYKIANPVDSVIMKVYLADKSTLISTSTTSVNGSAVSSATVTYFNFLFEDLIMSSGTVYFIEISRTGPVDSANKFYIAKSEPNKYAGGEFVYYNGTAWVSVAGVDMLFSVEISATATVVWKPVEAAEAINFGTVALDATLETGSVRFYLSQDGITWVEVSLNSATPTNFTSANVYLKCVMFGVSVIRAVAWGGY